MAYATNSIGNYDGSIIASTIRPNSPLNDIATVFSNEIKGSLHTYETINERDSIPESRRDWGMLVTVYNDPDTSKNKTYTLKYINGGNLNDNGLWVEYVPSGTSLNTNNDWIDSVQYWESFPNSLVDGARYLVKPTGIFDFTGMDNKIAVYSNLTSTFSFFEPTNGQTLRLDGLRNIIFKFEGTSSVTGMWNREYLTQVRYLQATTNDGLTYSTTSIDQSPIDTYSYSVYYVSFDSPSTGTVSLSIDGLPFREVKKLLNNSLQSMVSGDIQTGFQYQLLVNGNDFQTVLPSTSVTTIGPAEDGDYSDGLFTDFTTATPIGTAVDRFNEIMKALVPPSAPDLTSWSAQGTGFVNGRLSFDGSDSGFISATFSPNPVVKGGLFATSSTRLGINSLPLVSNITGTLNSLVPNSTQTPVPAFGTNSFSNGLTGSIILLLNGITVSNVVLTASGTINTTNSGATSGLILNPATSSKFSTGFNFDTFINRTGTYLIRRDDPRILSGYNYIELKRETSSGATTLDRYEWVSDSSTKQITDTLSRISQKGGNNATKWLSGIEFWNVNLNLVYETTLNDVYSNTYRDGIAITFNDISPVQTGFGYLSPLFDAPSPQSIPIPSSPSATLPLVATFSLSQNKRRVNEQVLFRLTLSRTVQGTFTGATSGNSVISTSNWYIDSFPDTNTPTNENFSSEAFRIRNGSSQYDPFSDTVSVVNTATWDSRESLVFSTNYMNGLQVINGRLRYPESINYTTQGSSVNTNPNFGGSNARNYTNAVTNIANPIGGGSNRTWTRYFNVGNTSFFKLKMDIKSTNSSFNLSNTITGISVNNLFIEIKLPGVTGWLNPTKSNLTGTYMNGDGCLDGSLPGSYMNWLISLGANSTSSSNGLVLVRITSSSSWVGEITEISLVGRT